MIFYTPFVRKGLWKSNSTKVGREGVEPPLAVLQTECLPVSDEQPNFNSMLLTNESMN